MRQGMLSLSLSRLNTDLQGRIMKEGEPLAASWS